MRRCHVHYMSMKRLNTYDAFCFSVCLTRVLSSWDLRGMQCDLTCTNGSSRTHVQNGLGAETGTASTVQVHGEGLEAFQLAHEAESERSLLVEGGERKKFVGDGRGNL